MTPVSRSVEAPTVRSRESMAENTAMHEEGREQRVVDHLHLIVVDRRVTARHADGDRDHVGALTKSPVMAVLRS